jgi:hypothetical protein
MVAYQADSPSRMCDGSLDEAARMVDSSCVSRFGFSLEHAYLYTCRPSSHAHMLTHNDATSGLVWRTVLRPHTSASSVLPSPLPTRMSLHHLTSSLIP